MQPLRPKQNKIGQEIIEEKEVCGRTRRGCETVWMFIFLCFQSSRRVRLVYQAMALQHVCSIVYANPSFRILVLN